MASPNLSESTSMAQVKVEGGFTLSTEDGLSAELAYVLPIITLVPVPDENCFGTQHCSCKMPTF